MSVKSREKIALVVFLGLIVLSLCGLGWYLLAGHSWNVAASNLDDTFGSMDGYTAIVYPGTAVAVKDENPPASPEAAEGARSEKDADGGATETPVPGADLPSAAKAAEGASATPPSDDVGDPAIPTDATPAVGSTDGSLAPKKKALSVDEAKEGYEDKGATVFSLDTTDLDAYGEGVILKKGGHRFGVFSIDAPASSIVLEKQIAYFKRYKVDFIVLVTPDKEYAEGVAGIDIVVSTQDEDLFVMGETIDGTFYVDAPAVGSVGAILISPSNVVSAKVLQAA